ncbi:MAG: hypothetical protein FWD49_06035 [Firmicutes bacterium]|nr:hypothetical protein [Bacillota bacterium]
MVRVLGFAVGCTQGSSISCPLRGSYGFIHMLACFQLQCAVGCTHGYAYPARFGAVMDLPIILNSELILNSYFVPCN